MLPGDVPLIRQRPFRAPRHTISNAGLVGAMNPCPCGYFGDPEHECTCSPMLVSRYQKRLSGPLLDRIDITYGVVSRHVEVPRVPFQKLSDERRGELSAAIRGRVEAARARQTARFAAAVGAGLPTGSQGLRSGGKPAPVLVTNADMGPTQVRDFCQIDETTRQLLGAATPALHQTQCGASVRQMSFSARAYHRILKLTRTIADLAGAERIQTAHIAEAIQYRPRRME